MLPVLVNWPVMNGTSCATLISASWLSIVTVEGVAITLVFDRRCSARIIAAKFTPVAAIRPMPNVVPVGSRAGRDRGGIVHRLCQRSRGSRRPPG